MTKKITLSIAALAALTLSACHHMPPCEDGAAAPNPTMPKVSIVDDQYLVVNQEPLVFAPRQKDVEITWRLPAASAYRFPEDGITFTDGKERKGLRQTADEQIVKCRANEGGLTFTCLNRHTRPGQYKYIVTVVSKDGKKLRLDPTIDNY